MAEDKALQESFSTLCENISTATTPTWFASKLLERELITPQLMHNCTQTAGVPAHDQVSCLLQAVTAQVKTDPNKIWELTGILKLEPALSGSMTALSNALLEGSKEGVSIFTAKGGHDQMKNRCGFWSQ